MDIVEWKTLSEASQDRVLARPATTDNKELRLQVADIIRNVRDSGDAALKDYAERFDNCTLESVLCNEREFDEADASLDSTVARALDSAISTVRRFHSAQIENPLRVETAPGVICERLIRPIDAVGLYVPAGTAPLPSAAIMLAVPATLAGCPQITIASPPRSGGNVDPTVLAVAKRLGIRRVVKAGGAQAIAALAFGTESVPPAYKICGPGNAWATEAKVQVAASVNGAAIDMPAGPSELMVLADRSSNATFVAADLLSQAEHGTDSQVVLVSTDRAFTEQVVDEINRQLLTLPRVAIAREAISNSAAVVVDNREQALALANHYAPEHLIIQMREPRTLLAGIRNAGSVFLGPWTPESVGDYCSGTNHVLPTYGYARNYSGLGVESFTRRMTVQELSAAGLSNIGPIAQTLANVEGLDAHARAVGVRLDSLTTRVSSE